jgi:phosphatidylcholine synthase
MAASEPAAEDAGAATTARHRAAAFAVHILTASGAAFGLLALISATDRDWPLMFTWLGAALLVDGVAATLPRWSGDSLDFVVDFVTYVFVPAYAIAQGGLMPPLMAIPAGIIIVITGALYFADREMKLADNCFRGFPALWSLAAFYLFMLRLDSWVAFAIVVTLAVLTFAPFPFPHPLRVVRLRAVNVVLLIVWCALAAAALGRNLDPGPWITATLCGIGLYFFAAGLLSRLKSGG